MNFIFCKNSRTAAQFCKKNIDSKYDKMRPRFENNQNVIPAKTCDKNGSK